MDDIRTIPLAELPALCERLGEPRYRCDQLVNWLYVQGAEVYEQMGNLPKGMREALAAEYSLQPIEVLSKRLSADGTRKYVFGLADGTQVEAVGIPSHEKNADMRPTRLTVCFSTQAGCAMGCAFCATGDAGFERDLSAGEMIMQVLLVQKDFDTRVSNIVSMGQGEPFQNLNATSEALRFFNSPKGFGIGARHITISTCGILGGIRLLAGLPEQFTLAVSLHSALQNTRDMLMPRCSGMPLEALREELMVYTQATGRRVSLEYLLIDGLNDNDAHLQALKQFCTGLLCHVNLIPINSVDHSPFQPSSKQVCQHWVKELGAANKEATIRESRGADIDGACGQLKNKLGGSQ